MLHPTASRAERTSLALSASSFVLAACALLVSLRGGGGDLSWDARSRLAAESAAERQAAPISVSLEQLSIGPTNILDGAVTASALASNAVTGRTLADGAVSMAKLSGDTIQAVTRAAARATQIVGEVDELGSVVRGAGFTSRQVSQGEYELHFTSAFPVEPIVVAVAQQYAICYLPKDSIERSRVRIKCMSDLLGSSPSAVSTRFSFYAAPPA